MRKETWTDDKGYRRAALVRDDDPRGWGPYGIPLEPPDIGQVNWELIQRELHNALVDQGLFTVDDVRRNQNAVGTIICRIIKREVITLFKLRDQEAKK
jgi:hypothetical protein